MRILPDQTVLLTGANGGLGVYMARAFAALRVKQALVAYPGIGLLELEREIEFGGNRALSLTADLRDPEQRRAVIERVSKELGPIDILVNNAGVEFTMRYEEMDESQIRDVISVNLEAAMILARLVLPQMLARKQGHIINISSVAGKAGPAFQEPYAATKAALLGFTSSLRASYKGTGVSASAIVPAFVEAGIYTRLRARSGRSAPAL
jgi:NAD(P)-dependent dehydrogenase (short-subunit alcohol dehydrogenase family)